MENHNRAAIRERNSVTAGRREGAREREPLLIREAIDTTAVMG
jgi:hypothetical protein